VIEGAGGGALCVLIVYFQGHRAEPLTGLLQRAPKDAKRAADTDPPGSVTVLGNTCPPSCCSRIAIACNISSCVPGSEWGRGDECAPHAHGVSVERERGGKRKMHELLQDGSETRESLSHHLTLRLALAQLLILHRRQYHRFLCLFSSSPATSCSTTDATTVATTTTVCL
jgi:hypothetical protein